MPSVRNVAAAASSVTATPLVVTLPTRVSGDVLVTVLEIGATSGVTLAGWTQAFLRSQAAATGNTNLCVMTRITDNAEGATASFAIAGTINHACGQCLSIQSHGATTTADLTIGVGTGGAASGSSPQVVTGIPSITVTAGSLVCIIGSTALDAASTTQFSAYTNTDPNSFTERMDNVVIAGNGGGYCFADGTIVGTSTGTAGFTEATNEAWNGVQIGIPPVAAAASLLWAPPPPPTVYIR